LVTHQTGPQGKRVKKVLVEQGLNIAKELYLSIIPDRSTAKIVIMASRAGGMDIEEVAAQTPEKIIKVFIDPLVGIQPFHCRQVAFGLNLSSLVMRPFVSMLASLYRLFVDYDCSLVEINPLVITAEDAVIALDAKMDFDDNALYRHKDIIEYRDVDEPANFLDVGGGASAEMVENGFRIMLGDKNVKGILINIFGGILRCDVLAEGVVHAAEKTGINVPVVIRMEGTNVEQGRKILAESGLSLITASDMKDAAEKVAQLVAG